jgi:membrane-associated phospholipid phosphatase
MLRKPGTAAAVGLAGIAGLFVVWAAAFHWSRARALDLSVFNGFWTLRHGRLGEVADFVPHLSDPAPFLLWFVLIVGTAIVRGRPRLALAAGAVLLGANLTTHLLKPVVAAARYTAGDIASASWPSGHATASMAVALCAVLVAPVRWRPAVSAIGAAYTIGVCFALLVAGWHFPSDVVAGYLMAGTWTAFAVAAVWASERRWPLARGRPATVRLQTALAPAVAVAVAGLSLFALVALAKPVEVTSYARDHTAFVVGAALIAALALSLVAGLTAVMTQARAPATGPGERPAPTGAHGPRWRRERG